MRGFRRWAAVAGVALVGSLAGGHAAAGVPITLSGTVATTLGEPIEGATVIVWIAGPVGKPGILCPSCYPDCGREMLTDAQGRFSFEEIDGALAYHLMVAEPGHEPKETDWLKPGESPHRVTLAVRRERPEDPRAVLDGRVIDENGSPVAFAVIEPDMFLYLPEPGQSQGGSSHMPGAELLAVTDRDGRFSLYAPEPIATVSVVVSAPRLAPIQVYDLPTGEAVHEFVLGLGAVVRGKLVDLDGEPVSRVTVCATGTNHEYQSSAGRYTVGTDEQGRFELANLPPKFEYAIHGIRDELHESGALIPEIITVGEHGAEHSVGTLTLADGLRLSGRVVTSDTEPLPARSVLMVSETRTRDGTEIELPPGGNFEINGLMPGGYTLKVRVPGYQLSERNTSKVYNRLAGRIDADITGLEVLVERPGIKLPPPPRLDELPLRGVEGEREAP